MNLLSRAAPVIDFGLRRDNRSICLHAAFLFFAGFSLFLTFHHVLWRDEAQAWLLARDLDLWGLFKEARHDGHPILWHLWLKAIQLGGADYRAMFLLNWAFIVVAVGLLFYSSSLPLAARLGFALCPSCLLHVAYNARNYTIAVLLIFFAAVLYRRVARHPILYAIVLALLDSTNSYAAAVSVGLSCQFLLEQGWSGAGQRFSFRPLWSRYLPANLILALGALLTFAQLVPIRLPGDPLHGPVLAAHFPSAPNIVIFGLTAGLALLRKRNGFPRILGGVVTALLALIPAVFYGCGTRHDFMIVAQIVYFFWVYQDDLLPPRWGGFAFSARGIATGAILAAALACQPAGLRTALARDSYSAEAARAILDRGLDRPGTLLVTTDPPFVTPLLLYFHHIRVTYGIAPFGPEPQSFADFLRTRMRTHTPSLEEIKPLVERLGREHPDKTIVVVSVGSTDDDLRSDPGYGLEPLYISPVSIPYEENYRVYEWKGREPSNSGADAKVVLPATFCSWK